MRKYARFLTASLLIAWLATACSPVTVDRDAIRTEVAATIYAEQTDQAPDVTQTSPPALTPPSKTEDISTSTPTVPATPSPTPADVAPLTSTPTPAPRPSETPTPGACPPDVAFVEDVTVPDGTNFSPSESFTKTWRLRSSGCAPWPAGSTFVFDAGDQMGAPESVPVPDTSLDSTADISVEMTAPDAAGTYKGYWQMQGPDGTRFGSRVYVLIVVPGPTPTPQACPPNPALVEVINELSIQLSVEVTGAQNATFVLPANATLRHCMMPGEYSFVATAAGYNPLTGTKTLDSGACQCWWFYTGVRVHPLCNCDSDTSHYVPLP